MIKLLRNVVAFIFIAGISSAIGQQISGGGSGGGGGSGLTIGTSTITSGTSGRVLYDAAGVVGEMTTTGSGTVVALSVSPTVTGTLTGENATFKAPTSTPLAVILDTTTDTQTATLSLRQGGSDQARITWDKFQGVYFKNNTGNGQMAWYGGAKTLAAASDFMFGWENSNNAGAGTKDTAIGRNAAGVVEVNNATLGTLRDLTARFISTLGQSRVSTQFDKTSSTTLADVTGLTVTVLAGKTYKFEALLYTSSNSAGGVKAAIAGTATATAITYDALTFDAAAIAAQTRATALATAVGGVTAVAAALVRITGTITVNAGGTLTVQFAQNASNGTASSVLVGSTFIVEQF